MIMAAFKTRWQIKRFALAIPEHRESGRLSRKGLAHHYATKGHHR